MNADDRTEITNEPIGEAPHRPSPHGIEGWFYERAFSIGGALILAGGVVTWSFGWFADSWSDTLAAFGLMAIAGGLLVLIRRVTHRIGFGHIVWFVACLVLAFGWFMLRDALRREATGPAGATAPGVIEPRRNHWTIGHSTTSAFEFPYRWRAGSRVLRDAILTDDPAAYAPGDTVLVRYDPKHPEVHVTFGPQGETLTD